MFLGGSNIPLACAAGADGGGHKLCTLRAEVEKEWGGCGSDLKTIPIFCLLGVGRFGFSLGAETVLL